MSDDQFESQVSGHLLQLATQRVVAFLRVFENKKLTPENFVVPIAYYESWDDFEFFKNASGDPTMWAMDYFMYQKFTSMVKAGLAYKGFKSEDVPMRKEQFNQFLDRVEEGLEEDKP